MPTISQFARGSALALALFLGSGPLVVAAPGDVLFSDNFERASLAPWTTNNSTRSGILTGPDVSSSGTRGVFTRHGAVTTTGPQFNAAVPGAELAVWVRRGSDAFSELPDGNENLVVEYRRTDGTFATLLTYTGGGPAGQVFNDTVQLPPDALHGALAIRVRQTGGSGVDFDYFHVDDIIVTERTPADPFGLGRCDEFTGGLAGNWTITGAGTAGTSSATFQTPSRALFTNGAAVTVTSLVVDTSGPSFESVSLWIRRGADSFSENPDGNENLVIEYLNDTGIWIQLESFPGSGTPGQILLRSYPMPIAARHSGFQLRIRQTGGSGGSFDFWHVDDVCLNTRDLPALRVSKTTSTVEDPINGTSNPFSIPGALVEYAVVVTNEGAGVVDANTLTITDVIPEELALFVDTSAGDPIVFTDSVPGSGLTFDFATDVVFSSEVGGGPPYSHTPTPDGDGFDFAITGLRVSFGGAMNGASGSNPSVEIRFRARVR